MRTSTTTNPAKKTSVTHRKTVMNSNLPTVTERFILYVCVPRLIIASSLHSTVDRALKSSDRAGCGSSSAFFSHDNVVHNHLFLHVFSCMPSCSRINMYFPRYDLFNLSCRMCADRFSLSRNHKFCDALICMQLEAQLQTVRQRAMSTCLEYF